MAQTTVQSAIDTVTKNWKFFAFVVLLIVLIFVVVPRVRRRMEINKALSDSRKGKYNPLADIAALEEEYNEWFGVANLEAYKAINGRTDEELRLFVERWSMRNPNLPLITSFESKKYPYSWDAAKERDRFLTRLRSLGLGG